MKFNSLLKFVTCLVFSFGLSNSYGQITTFTYTGTIETYTVPDDITDIRIEVRGAQGGGGVYGGVEGGQGAIMSGDFTVEPGDELQILVGGQGLDGIDIAQQGGGSGGGGSFVVDASDDPMIIAGGGGGALSIDGLSTNGGPGQVGLIGQAGGTDGGAGGSPGNGGTTWFWEGWHDGTGGGGFVTDGSDESSGNTISYGTPNGPGISFLNGGFGGEGGSLGRDGGFGGGGASGFTGGGGGGYSGGGSGTGDEPLTHSGGGGGSYNVGLEQDNLVGANAGDGMIIITPLCIGLTVTVSEYSICFGDEVTIEAESGGDGEITWDGGVENGIAFVPDGTGLIDYTATSTDPDDCESVVTIAVYELPEVEATVDTSLVCFGDEIILSGEGAATYVWDPDAIDGEPFVPELGTTVYTVIGTSGPGCEGMDEISITVLESPVVDATASDDELCYGESVIFSGTGADIYEWSPDDIEDGIAYTPSDPGSMWYYVIGYNSFGCFNEDSVEVVVNEEIVITYEMTEEIGGDDGEIDITVTGGMPPYTFDWDNDGTDDFDDEEDLIGIPGGTYTLVVKDDAGCTHTVTVIVESQVGIEALNTIEMAVYPNPFKDMLTVEVDGEFVYELTHINGAIVQNGSAVDSQLINLKSQANGVYLIKITSQGEVNTFRLIKQ